MSGVGKGKGKGGGGGFLMTAGSGSLYDIFSGARFFSFSFSLHKSIGLDSIIGHLVY